MQVAVYGTGGVGGYFGGRLAQAGHEVTFIARGEHLQAMRRDGLRVESVKGDFVVRPVSATDDPSTVGPVDLVLLGVKAWQVPEVAPAIRSMLRDDSAEAGAHPPTVVLPLQNGVQAADELGAVLGSGSVLGGLCRIVASIAGPGHITHDGIEPTVVIGELDRSTSDRVAHVRDVLRGAGIAVEVPDDIHVALWQKFLLVAPWGGLGGLTRLTLDVLCQTPETRRRLEGAMNEVAALAAAHGATLPADVVSRTAAALAALPPGNTASMQRDLMAGRPSELEQQTGAIVRLGREKAVATPINSFLYDCLVAGERAARAGPAR